MPVKRRKRKNIDDYPVPWEPRPVSVERWQRHRARMMAHEHPGHRPEEWWAYESPKPRDPDFDLRECVQLYEMGELTEEELAKLMPRWQEDYDRAQEPGFSYCAGYDSVRHCGKWISGGAARKAHLKWAGIPPELVKQWDREAAS